MQGFQISTDFKENKIAIIRRSFIGWNLSNNNNITVSYRERADDLRRRKSGKEAREVKVEKVKIGKNGKGRY